MQVSEHLDPESISRLQGLELRAKAIVDGFLSGMHRSLQRGQSVEFTEHREYAPGDDLRYVDWKVFAKTDKVYLKQFESETNLVCHLLLDISESMSYQGDLSPLSKLEYGQCLAAAMAYVVLHQRDSVSLTTFDNAVRDMVRESGNPAHLRKLTDCMQNAQSQQPSDLGGVFHELSKRLVHRGIVVVVSDCLGDLDSLLSGLKHLRHQRHEVIVLHLLDPREVDFRFSRSTLFRGLEQHPTVLAEPRTVRKAYLALLAEFLERLQAGCRSLQVDYQFVRTDEPFDQVLRRVLVSQKTQRGPR